MNIDESGPNHDGERSRLEPNHHDKGGPLVMAKEMVSLSQSCGNCSAVLARWRPRQAE